MASVPDRGLTYPFTTHDLSLAWVLADRIAVTYLGRICPVAFERCSVENPPLFDVGA